MDIDLQGKRVLVTGGNSGIGAAMALAFADAGADVAVNYVTNEPAATSVVKAIASKGRRAIALEADVSNGDEVGRMFTELDSSFGGIDVLLDNAGIESRRGTRSWETDGRAFERIVGVNLLGAFLCAREALRRMVQQKHGVVIFTSSVHQQIAWTGQSAYTATKGAVEMLMKTMAQEAGPHGVRVLSIAPGAIETPINTAVMNDKTWQADLMSKVCLKRIGRPEEVAELAVFLASDKASYVTATTIFIDGGMTDYPAFAEGG